MTYTVKEIYYTLQGEGAQTGRAAVFLRFAGCNLWTGREADRAKAVCKFCDTDFVGTNGPGGGTFETAEDLANAVARCWNEAQIPAPERGGLGRGQSTDPHRLAFARHLPLSGGGKYVVCTGGEPLLQLDAPLVDALHRTGFEVGVETNGTQEAPAGLDWICVSPKADAELKLRHGNELKLVYPQKDAPPERFADLSFDHFFLQPMDSPEREANTRAATDYCLAHPQWRLSLQTHKLIGIP
jgi:7-carboxy-7-deazaguanine synthase (Cx14CxxC type)